MADFQKGATVRLKSGGPKMTVEMKESDGKYRCVWFRKMDGTFESIKLDGDMLMTVAPPVPSETAAA
jgi:uncharacterized protein YodC (DUF2158 family)